ncbi:MAG: hypothetical protein ABIK65_06200 [Candidatus Eisenbacteria bacterium]
MTRRPVRSLADLHVCGTLLTMMIRAFLLATLLCLTPSLSGAGVNSLFLNGLTFFDTGGFDRTAADLRADDLSPGYDGDYLLTFRDSKKTSVLAGFGIFWSRRTERDDDIPFQAEGAKGRIQAIAFPFSVGFARRDPGDAGRGWMWGALAHYYYLKVSVDAPEELGTPAWFRLSGEEGERDGQGPALSVFAAYEVPFFLGRAGLGVKGRIAFVAINDERGLGTPDIDLTGLTIFLSAALR